MQDLPLRLGCFLASTASIAALMAHLHGLAPMGPLVVGLALPSCAALVGTGLWAARTGRREVATDLVLGAVGGLLGTLAYDLFRLPFHLAGWRVFAPISAFGLWILDAPASSRFTEVAGWSYHFLNGVTFGIMYALFMRGRHWAWAVGWGMSLEMLAVLSPFGDLFALRGNYPGLAIAFAGHVAYGIPLGLVVWRWQATSAWLVSVPAGAWAFSGAVGLLALLHPLWDQARVEGDRRRQPMAFVVEGRTLHPAWVRVARGESVSLSNPGTTPATIRILPGGTHRVPAGGSLAVSLQEGGIRQVFVQTDARSVSSFLVVEPVR